MKGISFLQRFEKKTKVTLMLSISWNNKAEFPTAVNLFGLKNINSTEPLTHWTIEPLNHWAGL